jgi:UDP-N-acetylmuramoylalanine--D-glutamate ligase
VLVAGAAVAGAASAQALLDRGVDVTVLDRKAGDRTAALAEAGARVVIGDFTRDLLDGVSDVVVSPGFAPHHPLAVAALSAGLDVYSEPELAWRLRGPDAPTWLGITGTNGKTTTTTMLAAILHAAGLRTAALGNIGEPLVTSAVDATHYDVVAVELSSFQLHWSRFLAPAGGALLNVADDHLEWHGTRDAYFGAKLAIWRDGFAVGNLDDSWVRAKLALVEGSQIGFGVGVPAPGQLGVVDGVLVGPSGESLVDVTAIRPAGWHNVSNALAASGLALGAGISASAVRDGLTGYQPEPHRNAYVATVAGVTYVDDSKATNPHAAYASLTAYPSIVWVAGGQLKNVDINDLVAGVADRLAGAVLLGVDRAEIAQALARHAPQVPVVDVARVDDGAMREVVTAAAGLARPGDTVLLAPAAASLDMYASYAQRGDQFAAAVRALHG